MILEVSNLCKQYIRGTVPFYAVDHVNLQAEKGDFVCILGHSGSGKSTLLNMTAGLLKPSGGSVLIDGADIVRSSRKKLSDVRNRKIGYIMQGQNLLPNFNVTDNICMPYYLSRGNPVLKQNISDLLDYVGLTEAKDAYPSQLSGGELRRAAVARALLLSPDLILADEPTANLDFESSIIITELLEKISSEGTAVIVSTHDMEIPKYSNKVYRMTKGRLSQIS